MLFKLRRKHNVDQLAGPVPVEKTVIITNHVNQGEKVQSRFIFTSKVDEERFMQLVQPQFGQTVAERVLVTVDRIQLQNSWFTIYWSMPEGRDEYRAFGQLEAYVLDLLEHSLGWGSLRIERAYSPVEVGKLCRKHKVNLSI